MISCTLQVKVWTEDETQIPALRKHIERIDKRPDLLFDVITSILNGLYCVCVSYSRAKVLFFVCYPFLPLRFDFGTSVKCIQK